MEEWAYTLHMDQWVKAAQEKEEEEKLRGLNSFL